LKAATRWALAEGKKGVERRKRQKKKVMLGPHLGGQKREGETTKSPRGKARGQSRGAK